MVLHCRLCSSESQGSTASLDPAAAATGGREVLRVFNFESALYWDDFTRKVMKDTLDEKLRILLGMPCARRGAQVKRGGRFQHKYPPNRPTSLGASWLPAHELERPFSCS